MADRPNLIERLRAEVLIGDGAMGMYLHAKGVPLEAQFERLNLVDPDLIRSVHREYIDAGAQVIETNTFGANRRKLAAEGFEEQTRVINSTGARLAREAVPNDVYVLGSVGPVGGRSSNGESDLAATFEEQIEPLAEGGVDALILETFARVEELRTAIAVAKRLCDLPIIAQIASSSRTQIGSDADPKNVARVLRAAGADVIGVNCGPGGPNAALRVIETMASATDAPLSAYANASFPMYVEGRFIYANNVDYFAEMAEKMADAGARLIGGCCGTTPAHIREVAARVRGRKPAPRAVPDPQIETKSPPKRANKKRTPVAVKPPRNFLKANEHAVNIIVEVDPPRGLNVTQAVRVSNELAARGANAVSIAENQLASVRMSSWALSHLIQRDTDMTAICHCTCRDRNLIGQQSELLGGYVLGVNHVLAITGDPIALGGSDGSSVFDTNSFGLIDMMSRLNSGENLRGESISKATDFVIGCGVNPNRRRVDGEIRRLEKKVALGATYAMTQPPMDAALVMELRRQTEDLTATMFIGVIPLVSGRNAEFLHNEVPGISLTDETRERMAKAEERGNAVEEGVAIAKEQIDDILDAGFRGVYIIPMLRKYEMAYALVEYIRKKA